MTGLNNYGQLGLGDTKKRTIFTSVPGLDGKRISAVGGGCHHSVCLATDGTLYSWGRGDSGQLGNVNNPSTGFFRDTPEIVDYSGTSGATAIAIGSNHSIALRADGNLFSWGYGDMLALGNGKESDELFPKNVNPKKLKGMRVQQIGAGGQHSVILASD